MRRLHNLIKAKALPAHHAEPSLVSKIIGLHQDADVVAKPPQAHISHEVVLHADPRQMMDADSRSPLMLYLREIGQVKLLTPDDEVRLAKRIKRGDAAARDQMIRANLRLVVKIAHDYENMGLPLLDLINEGNIGLMKAVERFDPNKGAKVSSYAAWWIKQSMRRALANHSKTIRLPVHVVDRVMRMRRTSSHLEEILGREPSDAELADELGWNITRVTRLRAAAIRPASLDAPIGEDGDGRFGDLLPDEHALDPYHELENNQNLSILKDLVDHLEPREKAILQHRFGLNGRGEKTLEEIGAKLGLTRERIRQVQNIAIDRLRRKMNSVNAVVRAA